MSHTQSRTQQIEAAIAAQRGMLMYRPVLRPTGRLVFQEALLQLILENGEVVDAKDFMPIAWALGRIQMLDVLKLQLVTNVMERARDLRLSLRVHPESLSGIRLRGALAEVSQRVMDRMVLDISAQHTVCEEGLATLRLVRASGASVFLYDFALGRLPAALLKSGICDGIKLHASLGKDIVANRDGKEDALSLIERGNEQDRMVIATGIAQQRDADWFIQNGIHGLQGSFVGAPVELAQGLLRASVG